MTRIIEANEARERSAIIDLLTKAEKGSRIVSVQMRNEEDAYIGTVSSVNQETFEISGQKLRIRDVDRVWFETAN
ncbi:MAG: hypothetical protein KGI73_03155 [Patescibacteria group bacterium]|nr:hypothetical protein [Patescibacteria group bacterium]